MEQLIADEIKILSDRLKYLEHIHPDKTKTVEGFVDVTIRGMPFILTTVALSAVVACVITYQLKKNKK
jgi:hypothetical protein